jgi:hypothetical protein
LAAGIGGDKFIANAAGKARALDVDVVDKGFKVIIGLGDDLPAEGVGLDDVGTGFEKAAVNGSHHVGLGEDEDIGVALEVLVMRLEALAAIIGLGKLELLQGGAHGPVDDDDALLEKCFEGMESVHGGGELCGDYGKSGNRMCQGDSGMVINISTHLDASMD